MLQQAEFFFCRRQVLSGHWQHWPHNLGPESGVCCWLVSSLFSSSLVLRWLLKLCYHIYIHGKREEAGGWCHTLTLETPEEEFSALIAVLGP